MAVRIIIAIAARIIPTAVAGFSAMVFPFPGKSAGFMGNNSEEMCEPLHTSPRAQRRATDGRNRLNAEGTASTVCATVTVVVGRRATRAHTAPCR